MQKFYDNKIEGRFDALENSVYEQIRANCDILTNIQLIRYLRAFKDIDSKQRAKQELTPQEI